MGKTIAFLIFIEADRVLVKGWESSEALVPQIQNRKLKYFLQL